MSWSFIAAGTAVSGFNTTITPAIPAFTPGQIAYLQSQSYAGSLPTPTIAGWQRVSPGVNANQIAGWVRLLQAGDTGPAISWGNQWASAWIDIFQGPASIAGIIHSFVDKISNSTNTVDYNPLSISQPGCLVIAGGYRNKTVTTNGGSFGALTGFTQKNSQVIAGTAIAAVTSYQIQTNATSIGVIGQPFATDSSQQYESFMVSLLPLITQTAIPAGPRQVFVRETIEQF